MDLYRCSTTSNSGFAAFATTECPPEDADTKCLFLLLLRNQLLMDGFGSKSVIFSLEKLTQSYTVFINGGRAERPGFEHMKVRLGRPRITCSSQQKWLLQVEIMTQSSSLKTIFPELL